MIEQLIREYLWYVCQDHHKDRDCHFYIQKSWSYGEFKGYCVVHHGYVNQENEGYSEYFQTYAEAENHLALLLKEWIKEEKECLERQKE